jgi:hypothetical protein
MGLIQRTAIAARFLFYQIITAPRIAAVRVGRTFWAAHHASSATIHSRSTRIESVVFFAIKS